MGNFQAVCCANFLLLLFDFAVATEEDAISLAATLALTFPTADVASTLLGVTVTATPQIIIADGTTMSVAAIAGSISPPPPCPESCFGFSCSYWLTKFPETYTCENLELVHSCDCSGCACTDCPDTCFGATCDQWETLYPDMYASVSAPKGAA